MIILVMINRAEMVKRDWVKPGAVVIDCGNKYKYCNKYKYKYCCKCKYYYKFKCYCIYNDLFVFLMSQSVWFVCIFI